MACTQHLLPSNTYNTLKKKGGGGGRSLRHVIKVQYAIIRIRAVQHKATRSHPSRGTTLPLSHPPLHRAGNETVAELE